MSLSLIHISLAELVKIDPKAIGVGQYQHDCPQKELDAALGAVAVSYTHLMARLSSMSSRFGRTTPVS